MAKTKTGKTTKGSRKSNPKYPGVKLSGGQYAQPGNIIVRQRGSRINPGNGTIQARDFTIQATQEGIVQYYERHGRKIVSVVVSA